MSSSIEKYKLEETLRRIYFKNRGDVLATAREAGLEDKLEYVRKITDKIKKSFTHEINFGIACFVTNALLGGREQRLILMEDRIKALMNKIELRSICCDAKVLDNSFEGQVRYKCGKCLGDCDVSLEDCINDVNVVRYLDRMRKEDELIYKFMVSMGFISKMDDKSAEQGSLPAHVIESQAKALTEEDAEMLENLQNMNGVEVTSLRKMMEEKIREASQTRGKDNAE